LTNGTRIAAGKRRRAIWVPTPSSIRNAIHPWVGRAHKIPMPMTISAIDECNAIGVEEARPYNDSLR
jgi:hypothetical protein